MLVIRDNNVIVEVEKVLGVFLIVIPVDVVLRNARPYREAGSGKTGKYTYGRIEIHKTHLDKVKAP